MAFTEVSGTVTRTFYSGKGAEVTETFKKRDGSEGKKRWTLWFESEHGLSEGDAGSWRGAHSDEVDDWEDKEGQTRHTVKRALNQPKSIAERGSKAQQATSNQSQAPADGGNQTGAQTGSSDPWNAPANYTEETPW